MTLRASVPSCCTRPYWLLSVYHPWLPSCMWKLRSCFLLSPSPKLLSIHVICPSLLNYSFSLIIYIFHEKFSNVHKIRENSVTPHPHHQCPKIYQYFAIIDIYYLFIIGLFLTLLKCFKMNPKHITISCVFGINFLRHGNFNIIKHINVYLYNYNAIKLFQSV